MAAAVDVPPRVRQFASELAQPQPMRRGSVSERAIRCGKANCACADDPKARHGPYPSLTQAVGGKTRSRFLTAEQAVVARQQIAAGRQFRAQIDDYWEACEEWADTQLQLSPAAPSGDAKKRGSQRSSKATSSGKSKRS
jgi:hypothetical protein